MRRAQAFLVPVVGALLCVAITLGPDLLPGLIGKTGYAWTPFNSSNYRVGDTYYYAPWVRELIAGEWPLQPPTNIKDDPNLTIEAVRAAPYVLAALPGLLFDDFRKILLANEAQSAALLFLGFYFIAYLLLHGPWPSFAAAMLAYYYGGLWQAIPPNGQFVHIFGDAPSLERYFHISIAAMAGKLSQLADPTEYDYIGAAFRYMHLSLSGPLLVLQILAAVLVFLKFSWPRAAALFALSLMLAFSYPSHPVIGYIGMIILCGLTLLERRWREFITFVAVGFLVLATLLALGLPEMVRATMQNSILLERAHFKQAIQVGPVTWQTFVNSMLINKFLVSTVLLVALFWRNFRLRLMVLGVGTTAYLVSCVTFLEPAALWPRFIERGVDLPWGGFVAAGLVGIAMLAGQSAARSAGRRAVSAIGATAVLALCLISAAGFGRFAWKNADNLTRFIPSDRWSAYEWIRTHLPRRTMLATLDWDDMAFLAVYTNVNLATGHSDLSGRAPEDQLRNFVAVWKMLGLSRDELDRLVTNSVPALVKRATGDLRHPPLDSPQDYASSEFAAGLLYWPYLSAVGNVPIATSDMKTNPDLISYVDKMFEETNADELRRSLNIQYVMLNFAPARGSSATLPTGSQLVFQNEARSIYRFPSVEGPRNIAR